MRESTVKYSIVIPHYNNNEGLIKLLASIPERDDIEVIIVDDNSEEKLDKRLIKSLSKKSKIYIYYNPLYKKGAGAARNIGISVANGYYIIFADSDDYFVNSAFSILDENLSEYADITYFTPTSVDLTTGNISDRHIVYSGYVKSYINDNDESIRYYFIVPWSKVYRRKFIINESIKFDEVLASNDVMFSLESGYKAKNIKAYNTNIYCVTRGVGTLTVNKNKKILNSRFRVEVRRAKYITEFRLPIEKPSIFDWVRRFYPILNYNKINIMFSLLTSGQLLIFPSSYYNYLKSPKLIYKRITRVSNSSRDKKYWIK